MGYQSPRAPGGVRLLSAVQYVNVRAWNTQYGTYTGAIFVNSAALAKSPGRQKPLLSQSRMRDPARSWSTSNGTTRSGASTLASFCSDRASDPQNGQRNVCAVAS